MRTENPDVVAIRSQPSGHLLEARMWLPRAPEDVFPFFADAFNLEAITPSWLRFSVLTPPPITMGEGAVIDYRLRLHGVPLRWRTLISRWEPPNGFVDLQLSGPYARWVHEHQFRPVAGGVLVTDRVSYRLHGVAAVHRIGNTAVAKRDLTRIFAFRHRALRVQLA
jgi:ligand-binding SRPBCC domain-containing protein